LFFLSLETSTVAFRTVLNELLFFFLALNLASFQYFCQEYFFFAFLFAFQRKFVPKIPAKSTIFSLQILWNFTFVPQIIRSPAFTLGKLWTLNQPALSNQIIGEVKFFYFALNTVLLFINSSMAHNIFSLLALLFFFGKLKDRENIIR